MRKIINFLFVLYILGSKSYSQFYAKGTFMIVAICKDGIVVGADTRFSLYQSLPFDVTKVEMFYDTVQKVFPLRNFAVCSQGQILFDDRFIGSYYKEFMAYMEKQNITIQNIEQFYQYINNSYPNLLNEFLDNIGSLLTAGYLDGRPCIRIVSGRQVTTMYDYGAVASDSTCGFKSHYTKEMTCNQAADLITKIIPKYATDYNLQTSVGGASWY